MVLLSADPGDLFTAADDALDLLTALLARPAWHRDALCREYRDVSFFPGRGESAEPARDVCRRCAVRVECATWALDRPDLAGVWGSTSARDRDQARERGLDVAALLDAIDTRSREPLTPSSWQTAPCRGCSGLLGRKDVERGDGWCWACRPAARMRASGEDERSAVPSPKR